MAQRAIVAALIWCLVPAPPVRGDEKSARAHLRSAGLRPVGSYFILPGEKELGAQLKTVEPLKRKLDKAVKRRQAYEKTAENNRRMLQAATQERRRLTLMLLQNRSEKEMVQIGAHLLELTDRISLLSDGLDDASGSREINRLVAEASDAYTGRLLDLRALAEETKRRYEALAADDKIQAALAELCDRTGRRISLGPRGIFARFLRRLEELEADVTTAAIELRAAGGVLWVDTLINGRISKSMILDTGASGISIPRALADEIGLKPTDDHATIRMSVADGRTVEGKLMSLDSVRVGMFSVEDVECVVLGPEMDDAPPLLGGSFLRHFTYEINHDAGTLTITKVKTHSEGSSSRS